VVGKKRMFVDALDSQIETRKAKIAKLEDTERDLEQSVSNKKRWTSFSLR
jgi:cell division protein FtsB